MQRSGVRPAVGHGDADQDVVYLGLGILDEDIEVAVLIENAGVDQLKLRIGVAAAPVFIDQAGIGKLSLRIFVQALHVAVGGSGIEVVIALLHIFAMVALVAAQAE